MKHQQIALVTVNNKDKVEINYMYKVVEKFVSINGEGKKAGQLAVFIRFKGCNLDCSYCDTKWANEKEVPYEEMSVDDIYNYIKSTKIKNCTLTGGEPLLQKDIAVLLEKLSLDKNLNIEIETNGSVDLKPYKDIINRPSFTMDYKLLSSGMEQKMYLNNFDILNQNDTVKFVAGSMEDLYKSKEIIEKYCLIGKCSIYLSPVFGKIEPEKMVEFLITNNMNDVNIQLQLHKFIWNPDKKGV